MRQTLLTSKLVVGTIFVFSEERNGVVVIGTCASLTSVYG